MYPVLFLVGKQHDLIHAFNKLTQTNIITPISIQTYKIKKICCLT